MARLDRPAPLLSEQRSRGALGPRCARLCVGYDSGDAVSALYKSPGAFEGGTIQAVGVTVRGEPYKNLEAEARRMLLQH